MAGIGTVVNVLAILAGGCAGLVLKGGLKARYQQAVIQAMGLCIIFIGGAGALNGMLSVRDGVLTGLDTRGTLGMILALAAGSLLDGRMERLGGWLKEKASRGEDSQFIQGFVTASLTVCVGAMAIVGSIQDGMTGDPSTLFTKSVLDLIIVMIFSSTYGKGAVFSALPVGALQGTVTLCAGLLAPVFSPAVVDNLSFLGSILIFCVGVNLAFGNKFKVANLLPALVVGALYTALV